MNGLYVDTRLHTRHLGTATAYENRYEILLVVECADEPELHFGFSHDLSRLVDIDDPDLRERALDLARMGTPRFEYLPGHLLIHLAKTTHPAFLEHDEVLHFG